MLSCLHSLKVVNNLISQFSCLICDMMQSSLQENCFMYAILFIICQLITYADKLINYKYVSIYTQQTTRSTKYVWHIDDIYPNISINLFIAQLNKSQCLFPVINICNSCNRLHEPWLTSAILKMIATKSKYFKLTELGVISEQVTGSSGISWLLLCGQLKNRLFSCF